MMLDRLKQYAIMEIDSFGNEQLNDDSSVFLLIHDINKGLHLTTQLTKNKQHLKIIDNLTKSLFKNVENSYNELILKCNFPDFENNFEKYGLRIFSQHMGNTRRYFEKSYSKTEVDKIIKYIKDFKDSFHQYKYPNISYLCELFDTYPVKYSRYMAKYGYSK